MSRDGETHITVNQYINLVNQELKNIGKKRIIGEITKITPRSPHYYFDLKDKDTGAILSCAIWGFRYALCGVELKAGEEIIVYGEPNIYAPSGRFSFIADTVELHGEGALKLAFEKLQKQLQHEGLFDEDRKRPLPKFAKKIGLITSGTGDAIVDFRSNLGRFGFEITFVDSRVEGLLAVDQLLASIKTMKSKDIDVLVMVRGGGSLESLQAYNNETIVRALAAFPKPVITGIGHEKDVTLADLVADRRESTPTGAAKTLNVSWELLINKIRENRERIRGRFEAMLNTDRRTLTRSFSAVKTQFQKIIDRYNRSKNKLRTYIADTLYEIKDQKDELAENWSLLGIKFKANIKTGKRILENTEHIIRIRNPETQLELGYSIVRSNGKVVRVVDGLNLDETMSVQFSNGLVESKITKINKK